LPETCLLLPELSDIFFDSQSALPQDRSGMDFAQEFLGGLRVAAMQLLYVW
jgi:hypothetical protein